MVPDLDAALGAVRALDRRTPDIGLILGSGLGGVAAAAAATQIIPYDAIPGMPRPSIAGHAGQLVIGEIEGHVCVLLQGRAHFYEGYTMEQVTFGVRLLAALGVTTLIVTNAAGGLDPAFQPGDLMLIADHLFLPGMAGFHPLRGPNDDRAGSRFPAMVGAYDATLRRLATGVAAQQPVRLREGVYAMVSGPSYETSAELRFLRTIGADAVGMSTCPEVVVARHRGLRVLGISLIANLALHDRPEILTHDSVVAASTRGAAATATLIRGVLRSL